jgi:hypothetical protein
LKQLTLRLTVRQKSTPPQRSCGQIASDAPPAFLICANDDEYGCDEVTMELLQKLRSAHVPVISRFALAFAYAFFTFYFLFFKDSKALNGND